MSVNCTSRPSRSIGGHRRLVDGRVFLVLEEVAQRMRDRRRVQEPGGELVEHRLEAVVVVRVHQHDVDVGMLELARSPETGEPAPEDEDARSDVLCRCRCSPKHRDRLAPRDTAGNHPLWMIPLPRGQSTQRRKTTAVLWPPKPNEFESATSTCSARALFAT